MEKEELSLHYDAEGDKTLQLINSIEEHSSVTLLISGLKQAVLHVTVYRQAIRQTRRKLG
ncbi:unnamed protein product [Sphenostylis stenocarpa]|uniref:Uncharacterized protein n=1 Tax=Sphenostylis stenocarpa TaxID=92480 RepID=A0AA86SZA7_9FABA|nr:unnamed protein product [Sphenostylis stenocarpa]